MNKHFIKTQILDEQLEELELSFKCFYDPSLFYKIHKKEFLNYDISLEDLIKRQSYQTKLNIDLFTSKYLPQNIISNESITLFQKCLSFVGYPDDVWLEDKLNFIDNLTIDNNSQYLKSLMKGNFSPEWSLVFENHLILDNTLVLTPRTSYDSTEKLYYEITPYNFSGLIAYLFAEQKYNLYEHSINVVLNVIKSVPEYSFWLGLSLFRFIYNFDKEKIQFVEKYLLECDSVVNYFNSIKNKPLSEMRLYCIDGRVNSEFENKLVKDILHFN